MFRSSTIAILSDVRIEVEEDKYIIYPVIKEKLLYNSTKKNLIQKISKLAKDLEDEYNEDIIKEIIVNCYDLLNK